MVFLRDLNINLAAARFSKEFSPVILKDISGVILDCN